MARIVFMGTPEFGVPVLDALVRHHEVVMVVTQPDRRTGRGRRRLTASPVKEAALERGLLVMQPPSLRGDQEAVAQLQGLGAELFVIAAFGQILRQNVLDIPPHGCIGVHASLLPRWRGAAPIAAAIRHGDQETGVTLMLTERGMDTGAIIAQESLTIANDDTTESLSYRLAHLGAQLLIDTLPSWLEGQIVAQPQNPRLVTNAPPLDKAEGAIDWSRPAIEIERKVRAFYPWPGTFCDCDGQRLKIISAHISDQERVSGAPGTVTIVDDEIVIATGEGALVVETVQLAGKRAMAARQFARGRQTAEEMVLR